MTEQNRKEISESRQTRAYAANYGWWVGLSWIGSFALFILGLKEPLAGNLGLLLGLSSLLQMIYLLRGFRDNIAPLSLGRAFRMAWLAFMAAALLTTAAQYIYMAYIDDGLMMRSFSEIMQQPEMAEAMRQMMPGQDGEKILNESFQALLATTPTQFAFSFLFWNMVLATLFAFPTALFSFSRPKTDATKQRPQV